MPATNHIARRSPPFARRFPMPVRPAFTLIELLLAVVLLDIGLLALVGLGAAITRDARSTRALSRASRLASTRLERMGSLSCVGSSAGTAVPWPGVTEWFTETAAPNETRILVDSVSVIEPRGTSSIVVSTHARC